jgi:hypothetical protein
MAKMFYTAEETAQKLGKTVDGLKDLVRAGKLREFRDGGKAQYRVEDVDRLTAGGSRAGGTVAGRSASASGEIVLEPADDDSSIVLASPGGSDVLSLDDIDSDPSAGTKAPGKDKDKGKKAKEGTVVSSVGVSVFDDDELDEKVDPLAQTAVTDVAGLGLDGIGSGSGILDLTRESDDTSLGAELLDEIYSDEDSKLEMGDATRAGLDEAISEPVESTTSEEIFEPVRRTAPVGEQRVVYRTAYAPDAASTGLLAAMVVVTVVLGLGGLASAGMVKGVLPSLVETLYTNLPIFAGVSAGLALIAGGAAYFVAKKRG